MIGYGRQIVAVTSFIVSAMLFTVPADAVLTNDDCASPALVATLPFADSADVSTATGSPSDPPRSCASATAAHSVWYSFTAGSDGVVTASTAGSSFDTILTVFTGSCAAPSEVACNDDSAGTTQSKASFAVSAGTTYLVQVTAFNEGEAGTLQFAMTATTPPAVDTCAQAAVVSPIPFSVVVDTTAATTSPSDPVSTTCGLNKNSASVWYRFDAPSNGALTVDTFGSDYDTVVMLHTGTCDALQEASCNDDDDNQAPQSRLTFAATGGVSYRIEITAYGAKSAGELHLAATFTPTSTDSGGLDDAAAAKAADKCQRAITKSASERRLR
jgi:hypothetical protein